MPDPLRYESLSTAARIRPGSSALRPPRMRVTDMAKRGAMRPSTTTRTTRVQPLAGTRPLRWVLLVAPVLLAALPAWGLTITRGPFIQNPDALTSTITIEWWTDSTGD